ncbi:MAG: hypothetical protein SVM80_07770 [Halobacteriota archaeon]|nr:hypothetical protein [Halobacteriota archaeon]
MLEDMAEHAERLSSAARTGLKKVTTGHDPNRPEDRKVCEE